MRGLGAFYVSLRRADDAERYLRMYATTANDLVSKLTLADFLLSRGNNDGAIAILEPLAKEKDGFAPATLRLAAIEFDLHRAHAYELIDTLLKTAPQNERAILMKARFFINDKKPSDALALTNQVLKANPQSAAGKYLQGEAFEGMGSIDEAITAYQDLLKLKPSDFSGQVRLAGLYLARGDFAGAEEQAGQAVKLQPTSGVAHAVLAKALLGQNKLNLAEAEVASLAKRNERSDEFQAIVGDMYFAKRDLARARTAYQSALRLQPDSFEALTGLVKVNLIDHKVEAARESVEARLAAAPTDVNVLNLAGTVYTAQGDGPKAEAAFKKALDVDPARFDTYSQLATFYMMRNRLDDAKRDFEEVARRQPKAAVGAQTMVGIILSMQHKTADARKQYEQVLAADPQAAVAANNLAWDYAESGGNLDTALSLAQTAKARLPNSWEASDTLGWIYYKKGLATLAVTALHQSADKAPTNPTVQYHLGLAYLKSGDKKAARKFLEQALKLDPKFEAADDARRALATIKG